MIKDEYNDENKSSPAHTEKYDKAPKSEFASLGHPEIGDTPEKKADDESTDDSQLQNEKQNIANQLTIDRQKKLKIRKDKAINSVKISGKIKKGGKTAKAKLKKKGKLIKILAGIGGFGFFTGIIPVLSIFAIIVVWIFKKVGIIKK